MKTDKKLASEMQKTLNRRNLRKSYTCGMYCLDVDTAHGKMFAPPFLAINDDIALDSLFELANTHPELQGRNLFCIGTYCSVDGKIVPCKPRHIIRKEKTND